MENTEIHYEMTVYNGRSEWNEKITEFKTRGEQMIHPEPTTDEEAIESARKMVAFFNETLRPGELKRYVTCVQRVETKVIDITPYRK